MSHLGLILGHLYRVQEPPVCGPVPVPRSCGQVLPLTFLLFLLLLTLHSILLPINLFRHDILLFFFVFNGIFQDIEAFSTNLFHLHSAQLYYFFPDSL